jgi:hypothetical protein
MMHSAIRDFHNLLAFRRMMIHFDMFNITTMPTCTTISPHSLRYYFRVVPLRAHAILSAFISNAFDYRYLYIVAFSFAAFFAAT